MNVVHIKGQPKATYWGRVTQYFHNYKTFASDREEKSLLQRWSTIQLATKKFCEYVTQVENEHKYGMNEQDKVNFFFRNLFYFILLVISVCVYLIMNFFAVFLFETIIRKIGKEKISF